MNRYLPALAGCFALMTAAAHASLPNGIYALSTAPGYTSVWAHSLSPDGLLVGGGSSVGNTNMPTIWSVATGEPTLQTHLPTPGWIVTVTNNAEMLLGVGPGNRYRYTTAAGAEYLIAPPGFSNPTAYDMSDNGIIAGLSFPHSQGQATRWTTPQSGVALGTLPTETNATSAAINADGSVIVGHSGPMAFRWVAGQGMQALGILPGDFTSRALGVSGDGDTVVGFSTNVGGNVGHATRWTPAGGLESIGRMPGGSQAVATATSFDGSIIVGSGNIVWNSGFSYALIWLPGDQSPRPLTEYLESIGINVTGWQMTNVTDISADGRAMLVNGAYNGDPRSMVVVIPAPGASALLLMLAAAAAGYGHRRRWV
jgi:hypothetical protein